MADKRNGERETTSVEDADEKAAVTVNVDESRASKLKAAAIALRKLREKEEKYKKLVVGMKKSLKEKQTELLTFEQRLGQKDEIIQRLRAEFKDAIEESDERILTLERNLDEAHEKMNKVESVASSKHSNEGTDESSRLNLEPRWVLQRVVEPSGPEAGRVWCLVGWRDGGSGWELEDSLVERTRKDFGVDLSMPPLTPNADSIAQLRDDYQSAKDDLKRVKQDFRRYRVRAELTIRQKESALNTSREELSRSFGKKVREIAGTDLAGDLKRARSEIVFFKKRLSEAKKDCERAVSAAKRHNDVVEELKAQLEEVNRERSEWQLRYENFVQEQRGRDLAEAVETAKTGASDAEYELLRKKFEEYKRRAMVLVQEREMALQDARAQLSRLRDSGGYSEGSTTTLSRDAPQSSSSSSFLSMDGTRGQYLRNIILQYMSTSDPDVKDRLETAMEEILGMTEAEKRQIYSRKRSEAGWVGGLFGK
eukprot:g236.t1